ncbi:unnamed protein product [Paramecium octaurelia]|uniref:Uncharacterized protein n=1 Tax=Paramecium octaurelia TaxID=43137 RepID=A0A8S1YRH2_PAROT|nr:unnamed protein product [Paramecium octaurelia]
MIIIFSLNNFRQPSNPILSDLKPIIFFFQALSLMHQQRLLTLDALDGLIPKEYDHQVRDWYPLFTGNKNEIFEKAKIGKSIFPIKEWDPISREKRANSMNALTSQAMNDPWISKHLLDTQRNKKFQRILVQFQAQSEIQSSNYFEYNQLNDYQQIIR